MLNLHASTMKQVNINPRKVANTQVVLYLNNGHPTWCNKDLYTTAKHEPDWITRIRTIAYKVSE